MELVCQSVRGLVFTGHPARGTLSRSSNLTDAAEAATCKTLRASDPQSGARGGPNTWWLSMSVGTRSMELRSPSMHHLAYCGTRVRMACNLVLANLLDLCLESEFMPRVRSSWAQVAKTAEITWQRRSSAAGSNAFINNATEPRRRQKQGKRFGLSSA